MIPQPPEFLDAFSTDRRQREAVAAAERLRSPGILRARAASTLRGLADRLAPASVLPQPASSPAAVPGARPAGSRCHPVA